MIFKTTNSNCLHSISGKVQDNTANYTLQLKRFKGQRKIPNLRNAKSIGGNNELWLDLKNLPLNYESWKMDSNNLYVLRKGIYANNFELSAKAVSAYNHSLNKANPLAIDFKDLK
jgi:hypothetical protein